MTYTVQSFQMFFVSSFVPILSPQEDSTMQISSESPASELSAISQLV